LNRILDDKKPAAGSVKLKSSFVEAPPHSLGYVSAFERGDHTLLFYDNLVVAAEYISAFIDSAVEREEPTCFVGLSRTQYETILEQVGIKVNELENADYLKHMPISDFHHHDLTFSRDRMLESIEKFLTIARTSGSKGIRFIIMTSSSDLRISVAEIIERERTLENLRQYPMCVMCCFPSRMAIVEEPKRYFFLELLKSHNHCLFQGVGIPTRDLIGKFASIPTLKAEASNS
jgi:hypothetical protein